MRYLKLLRICPGGWLLLSVLYFFGDWEGLVVVLGNAAIHEAGHLFMLRRYGVRIRCITFDLTGMCIHYNGLLLSAHREFLTAAAGPAVGLAASLLVSGVGSMLDGEFLLLFAGAGAVLSLFNLLPAKPLDGWRMVKALCPPAAAVISLCTALAVLVTGVYVMVKGWGTALAFMGLVLLCRDEGNKLRR